MKQFYSWFICIYVSVLIWFFCSRLIIININIIIIVMKSVWSCDHYNSRLFLIWPLFFSLVLLFFFFSSLPLNVININYKSLSKIGMKKLLCCDQMKQFKWVQMPRFRFQFLLGLCTYSAGLQFTILHTQRNHAPTDHVEIQHLHIHCIDSSVGFLIRIRIIF